MDKSVLLQMDSAYSIGKSVAVLHKEQIIGHLTRYAAKPIWMHLKFGHKVEADVYKKLDNGFENSFCFSSLSKSIEVGIRIRLFFADAYDGNQRISDDHQAKLFLSYIMRHRLNCFPGVTTSNCPLSVEFLVRK